MKIGEKAIITSVSNVNSDKQFIRNIKVVESGAFNYGNRTCVVIECNGETQYIDTRYYRGSFKKFVKEFIDEWLDTIHYDVTVKYI